MAIKHPVRIVQRTTKNSLQINLPFNEGGWSDGDVVKFEQTDPDTIVIRRLRERSD